MPMIGAARRNRRTVWDCGATEVTGGLCTVQGEPDHVPQEPRTLPVRPAQCADMHVQRRQPRVPPDQPGEMEIKVRAAAGATGRAGKVPVTIRTVSCEGMGLALRTRDLPGMGPGTQVTMRLQVG